MLVTPQTNALLEEALECCIKETHKELDSQNSMKKNPELKKRYFKPVCCYNFEQKYSWLCIKRKIPISDQLEIEPLDTSKFPLFFWVRQRLIDMGY